MTDRPNEALVQVGWYCWRCQAVNAMACRSDSVPVHVPAEWADEIGAEIARREDEDDEGTAPAAAEATELRTALAEVLRYLHALTRVGGSVIGYQTVNVIPAAAYDRWCAVRDAGAGEEQQ
ncbi:hypothetical protein [Streptomyces sp. NPDC088736]|uniref:hypothetical protein n=1 Tax=Streptomyces sp. NPDC088736 TaxID=3365881 RepID=UPI0037FEECEC